MKKVKRISSAIQARCRGKRFMNQRLTEGDSTVINYNFPVRLNHEMNGRNIESMPAVATYILINVLDHALGYCRERRNTEYS